MAIKTIETKAVISAQDQTGQTFSAVAEKLKGMEGAAKRASETAAAVGGNFGAIGTKIDGVSRSISAMGVAIAGAAVIGVEKLRELASSVVEVGVEFDKLTRRQQAVLNISAKEQIPLIEQARRLGGTTPFNIMQVGEAQTELAKLGLQKEQILPTIEAASNYAQAQGIGIAEATKLLQSAIFAEKGRQGGTPEELGHIADVLTKGSQVSGMSAAEMEGFLKGHAAEYAGMSLPFLMAQGAVLKQSGLPEGGQAALRFATMLNKPTPDQLNALDSIGVRRKDYITPGTHMRSADLSASFERELGHKLSAQGLSRVQAVLSNKSISGDQKKLNAALTDILTEGFDPKKDKARVGKISKIIEGFWNASIDAVDVEGLEKALIKKGVSSSQVVEIFGKRAGMTFEILAHHAKDLAEFEKQIREAPKGLAAKEAATQMGGLAGAKIRAEGEWTNVLQKLSEDMTEPMTALYNAESALEKAFVDASPEVRHLAEAAAIAATALVTLGGLHTGLKMVDKMGGGGTIFGAGAAGLGWLGGALLPGPSAIAAGVVGGALAGSTTLGPENEFARQRAAGIGAGRWLSNQPPEAGKFTPTPGGLGAFRLEGAASIGVRVDVGFDPGLLAKQITQTLDAGGNLRADTGISMPRR